MKGKTVLVTGATEGIGRETALGLARMGARVLIVGRSPQKCLATVEAIRAETGNGALTSFVADLSQQSEIARLAGDVQRFGGQLDVLVNNAGGLFLTRQLSADGHEMTFALNHLGYFALTLRLLDLLKASAPARIVNVASGAHFGVTLDFEDLMGARSYGGWRAYQRSKLCNILFTTILAERLSRSGVTANSLHPGFVASQFGNNNTGVLFRSLFGLAKRIVAVDVRRGAQTSLFLSTSPKVEGITGQYFAKCRIAPTSEAAKDRAAAERLWEVSAGLTGLDA